MLLRIAFMAHSHRMKTKTNIVIVSKPRNTCIQTDLLLNTVRRYYVAYQIGKNLSLKTKKNIKGKILIAGTAKWVSKALGGLQAF